MPEISPFSLAAPQPGPTAAPRVVRSNPFAGVGEPSGSDRLRAFGAGMAGFGGQFVGRTLPAERDQERLQIAQRILAERAQQLSAQGLTRSQVMQHLIQSPEFTQSIAEVPADKVFDFVTSLAAGIGSAPVEPTKLSPGDRLVSADETGKVSSLYEAPSNFNQLVSGLKRAVDSGDKLAENAYRAKIFGKEGTAGNPPASILTKMRAAGLNTGVSWADKISPAKAREIEALGSKPGAISNINDWLIRAGGGKSGKAGIDAYTPEQALAMATFLKENNTTQDLFEALFSAAAARSGHTVPGADTNRAVKGAEAVRKALEAETSPTAPGGTADPGSAIPVGTQDEVDALTPDTKFLWIPDGNVYTKE